LKCLWLRTRNTMDI